jgi:enoyl-CoA hydratase/carnithine racemase
MSLSVVVSAAGVWTLDFNRADKHNALTVSLYQELATTLRAAQKDNASRAVILSGSGKNFCAGNDLGEFETAWPQPKHGPAYDFLAALHEVDLPIVAAVQGGAIGIGATSLLQCDVIFAAPSAYLRYPFIDLGIVLEGGSSHLLIQRIGRAKAMEILLSGRKVPAEEAERLGLISSVTDDPIQSAQAFCLELSRKSPEAARVTKRLVKKSYQDALPGRFQDELDEVNRLILKRRGEL